MGKIMDNKFKRRFGGRIYATYPAKLEPPAKRRERNIAIAKAFEMMSAGTEYKRKTHSL